MLIAAARITAISRKRITLSLCLWVCAFSGASANLSGQPPLSAEDKELVYETATALARCAGAYEAVALSIRGKQSLAAALHDNASGAGQASAWLLYSMGAIADWAEAQSYSSQRSEKEKDHWLALLASPPETASISIRSLGEYSEQCTNTYAGMQENLVRELRHFMDNQAARRVTQHHASLPPRYSSDVSP